MNKKIEGLLDKIIPRGGEKPGSIEITLIGFLLRVSNLYRKLQGVEYRMKQWTHLCDDHKKKMKLTTQKAKSWKLESQNQYKITIAHKDSALENELEVLFYTISSTLSALTHLMASIVKGATDSKSHSGFYKQLKDQKEYKDIHLVMERAMAKWAIDLKERRDAATHYTAVSITTVHYREKMKGERVKKNTFYIHLPKTAMKSASIWEETLPTAGRTSTSSFYSEQDGNKTEKHKLADGQGRIILLSNNALPVPVEQIDGEKFVKTLHKELEKYVIEILTLLSKKI